jgi:hypothetical protein
MGGHVKPNALCLLLTIAAAPLLAAESTETISKTFPAPHGKIVLVDAGPLDLYVRTSDISEIRLKVELTAGAFAQKQAVAWVDAHRPTIEDAEGTLRITAPDPTGYKLLKGVIVSRARIELVLPPGVQPDLSTSSGAMKVEGEYPAGNPLRLRTASGLIEFAGWAPQIEARSTSGDMRLLASRALDHLLGRSASGELWLTGGARSVRCDSSSGDVYLEGLLGPIGITTTSGSVTARFDSLAATDEVKVSSTSGKVRLTLPPACEPGGEVTSAKAEIRSIYPGHADPKGGRLQLAGRGPKMQIATSSGRIELL